MEATAPWWPEQVIAQGGLAEAAALLAHPDGADRATVQARYDVLLADIQEEATPTPEWQRMAAEFAKVTASYGAHLFPCYDVVGLPRTDNDLEQWFGSVRHPLRRATGQKNAPTRWVVNGATRLSAAVATTDLSRWRAKRALLQQRRLPRILGRRFRRNPDAYWQELEDRLVKLSLPP